LLGLAVLASLGACRKSTPIAADSSVPARVVSLSPSTTEAVVAIGARASLVGRSRYCDYPPDIKALPEVGGYVDPNLEAILALHPTLVVGARGPAGTRITDDLATHGVETYFPATESFDAIDAMITGLGARLDRAKEARDLVASMHAREDEIERRYASARRPRVLLVFGVSPVVVAGPKTFADEMLARAHTENAMASGTGYPTLGMEHVLALDPDAIIDAAWGERGKEALRADAPGWGKLRAIREGRVVHLTDESVLRPGPRVGDGLEALARAVHGF
jgi:iron complex transport system substrate-binding protein